MTVKQTAPRRLLSKCNRSGRFGIRLNTVWIVEKKQKADNGVNFEILPLRIFEKINVNKCESKEEKRIVD